MKIEELKQKALALPLSPGVYLMHDESGTVIYVGKAKKLRNRVSQYFFDFSNHSPKTRLMVSRVDDFEVIIARDEFEALILECSLIKRHLPKYNILLKDDKGFPFVRVSHNNAYPQISMSPKEKHDGANYFGPFGARHQTQQLIDTVVTILKLPSCKKSFPGCIGKGRTCLNADMDICEGWCSGKPDSAEYCRRIAMAEELFSGNRKTLSDHIRSQIAEASDTLDFERAAVLRDRLNAIETLGNRQLVSSFRSFDMDVVGYRQIGGKGCLAVLHYLSGTLACKDCLFVRAGESESESFSSAVFQYYFNYPRHPAKLLLSAHLEDGELLARYLSGQRGKTVTVSVPQRGNNKRLASIANDNAFDELQRSMTEDEHRADLLLELGRMLCLPGQPDRIESFDISNLAGSDIVASMVVFAHGKPAKAAYRRFRLENMDGQDDYEAMKQVLLRRFRDFLSRKTGFDILPDLLLIDGGLSHVNVAVRVLRELQIDVPVFGMVKDSRHRTRALIAKDGREVGIASKQFLFSFVGRIQEETHRFAITYQKELRKKRMTKSALDAIPGIGPKRRQLLLDRYRSVSAVSSAGFDELRQILNRDAAAAVYNHFHPLDKNTDLDDMEDK